MMDRYNLEKWRNEESCNLGIGAQLRRSYRILESDSLSKRSYSHEWECSTTKLEKDEEEMKAEPKDDDDDVDADEDDGDDFDDMKSPPLSVSKSRFSFPKSNMETLDRRISASTDQLDTIRRGNIDRKSNYRSRSASRTKTSPSPIEKKSKSFFNFCVKPDKLENRRNHHHHRRSSGSNNKKERKTAFDIFLEDQGPYSRRLYGPLPRNDVDDDDKESNWKNSTKEVKSNDKKDEKEEEEEECLMYPDEKMVLQRGLLWQQRDKFFSRWKERFFILTKDYLNCFKKGSSRLTEMGHFIFKLKLADIESVDLLDKRGYLTICITVVKDGKIYLRRPEGIKDWFHSLQNNIFESKKKKRFWTKRQISDSPGLEQWLLSRQKLAPLTHPIKAVSSPNLRGESHFYLHKNRNEEENPRGINRMMLVNELISKETSKKKKVMEQRDSGNDSGHNSINTMSDSQSEDNLSSTKSKTKGNLTVKYRDKSQSNLLYRRTYAYGQNIPV